MSFAYTLAFLCRSTGVPTLTILLFSSVPMCWGAGAPTKITIHVPGKTLAVLAFYFGKDKGFFSQEGIDAQLVAMAPPTAIVALVAGELDFSRTLGAATSAMMRGSAIKRVFYVQHEPTFALTAQPEIKSIRELMEKVIGVNAPTDAVGMSAKLILSSHGIDPSRVTFLSTQVTENALLKTMAHLRNPENRREMVQYIAASFKINPSVADKAFASMLTTYSANGTKPRAAIEREIEIYRETVQVAKPFTPDDLEDMSILKKLQSGSD